jgi:hypothetical protein
VCNVEPKVLSMLVVVSGGHKTKRVWPLHTLLAHRSVFLCNHCLWVLFLFLVLNSLYKLLIQLGMGLKMYVKFAL